MTLTPRDAPTNLGQPSQAADLLVAAMPCAVLVVDRHGAVRFANAEALRLAGALALVGRSLTEFLRTEDRAEFAASREAFLAQPKLLPLAFDRVVQMRRADGETTLVAWGLAPLADADAGSFVLTLAEMTAEQRPWEAMLRRANEDLQARHHEIERFIYTFSHDLKSPLTTGLSFIQFLREDLGATATPEVLDSLSRLERANSRMSQLINDLLQLIRAGRQELAFEHLDLEALVQELKHELELQFPAAARSVRIEGRLPSLRADRSRILHLFENLLTNACKYGFRDGGDIVVGCVRESGELRFYVRDHGKGIAPEHHKRVFSVFERLETDRSGTGVGLAIVARAAQVHGGRAWVESSPGCGATFWITLPDSLLCPESHAK